jgi:arginine-tRNA-protein transferase
MSRNSDQTWANFLSMIEDMAPQPEGVGYPCPYLPGRRAKNRAFWADRFSCELYQRLMDRGFRRSGSLFYQPACVGCSECKALRIPVAGFKPSRSQRRVWRRNADLAVTVGRPVFSEEKHRLYVRYLTYQHDGLMGQTEDDARRFLYESPVESLEFCYRLNGRLVAAGIADISAKALSSVYLMFDPAEARRSLGTYSALWEIQWCLDRGIPYYYLGFYVRDCRKMNYKACFRPCQLLGKDGRWRSLTLRRRGPRRPDEERSKPGRCNRPSVECR